MPHAAGIHWVTVWCGVDDNPKDTDGAASLGNLPQAWCKSLWRLATVEASVPRQPVDGETLPRQPAHAIPGAVGMDA